MAIGLIIAGAVAVGGAVYSGISGSNTTRQNAQLQQQAALWNAQQQTQVGMDNAMLIGMSGMYNANLSLMSSQASADAILAIGDYNSQMQSLLTDFNTEAILAELPLLFEERDLSLHQLEQTRALHEGSVIANQAASGTVVGQDSNFDVVVDLNTQYKMDEFIIRHNADIAAADIENAAAKSQWEGDIAVQQLQFESQMGAWSALTQGKFAAAGSYGQAALDAQSTLINSQASADSILMAGTAAYESGINTANQQFTAGIINGISAATKYSSLMATQ